LWWVHLVRWIRIHGITIAHHVISPSQAKPNYKGSEAGSIGPKYWSQLSSARYLNFRTNYLLLSKGSKATASVAVAVLSEVQNRLSVVSPATVVAENEQEKLHGIWKPLGDSRNTSTVTILVYWMSYWCIY